MKYFIQTYGCQMNYSDSERISGVLERIGYEKAEAQEESDFLIFNTCSVKQKAEDKVLGLRKTLRNLLNKNPRLHIAITGCMVAKTSTSGQLNMKDGDNPAAGKPDKLLRRMPELDIAFRIEDVARLPELLKEVDTDLIFTDQLDEGTLENYFKIAPKKTTDYSVFVPIMTGCDKFCTYCIVPYTRGREFSRDFDEIVDECKKHVSEGAIEITLVGQTVNSYGLSFNDKKTRKFEKFGASPFATLLKEIDRIEGLKWLRFTSPHPRDFSDELIATLGELKTICPYFHMPVQSGDDAVLRRMNRNYRAEEYKKIMSKLRKAIPNCAISTDIIVGFCGETEEEFENTYNMYKELEWDMCFLSRYSPRKGTFSEKKLKDDISHELKAERWHRLNKLLIKCAKKSHERYLGKTIEVLVTSQIGQQCIGRSKEYKEVHFTSESGRNLIGQMVDIKVDKAREFLLSGKII